MSNLNKAIDKIMECFENEYGKDAKFEDGDRIGAVLNDAVITFGYQNNKLNIDIIVGKPYIIDMNLTDKSNND